MVHVHVAHMHIVDEGLNIYYSKLLQLNCDTYRVHVELRQVFKVLSHIRSQHQVNN